MYSKKLFSKSHYYVGTEAYLPVHLEQGAIYIAIDTRTTWCYDLEQNPQQINPAAILTSEQSETLSHFRYNPETDKLEGDRSIETLLSSLYLGTAWKISSAGDAITFVTEEFNESYFPITYGFKDHEDPAYQGPGGFITPKVASVGDLLNVEIFGPAGSVGTSTDYTTSGITTDNVFIFSIEIIVEQEIIPTDIILYEFFGGPDFSYPLVYEQRLTNLSLQPGDVLHMQFSNPLKQVAGSDVSTRLAYARDDVEIQTRNIEDLDFIKVRPTAADPNQHYSKVQLRFYTENPLITETEVVDLIDTAISSQDFMRQSVYDLNNIGTDVFDMDNMLEGTTNKILTLLERGAIISNTSRLDAVEGDISTITLALDGKLEAVSTDSTLTGDGTILSPLSVVSTTEVKEGLYAVHSENTALTALTQNVWSQIVIAPTMHVIEGFTHDGAGTFTYTGSNPKKFVLEATISQVGKGDDKMCYFAWYINGISKPGIMAQDMHKSKYYGDVNPKTVTTLSNGDSCNVWMVNVENSDDTTIKYINITIHEF